MPAVYTDTIYDILQRANPEVDLTSLSGVHDAAKASLFNDDMLATLDEKYRDIFVTAFALHYMQDEIGLPTFYAWKIALFEKMVTSSAWLNLIFDNLDKQVFSHYSVTHTTANGTDKVTSIGDILKVSSESAAGNNVRTGGVNTTSEESGTTSNTSNNGASTTSGKTSDKTDGTSVTDSNNTETTDSTTTGSTSGTEATDKTVNGTSNSTETDNLSKTETGTQKNVTGGTDKTGHQSNRKEVTTPSGTQTTEYSQVKTDMTYGTANTSGSSQYSDTPQSGLNAVASGTYLTNATYTTGTADSHSDSQTVGSHTEKVTGGIGSTTTVTSDATGTYDSTTYGKTDTRTDDLTEKTTGTVANEGATMETTNGTVTNTGESTDTTKGSVTDTGKQSTTDSLQASGTSETTTTQTKDATSKGTSSANGSTATTYDDLTDKSSSSSEGEEKTNTENTKNGETSDVSDSYSYSLNMEAFMRAEPFMNHIWKNFDDLFMCVYNTYSYPFNIFDI